MPGLDESLAIHSLDVDPKKKPVKQKRRNFAPERQKAIDEEVGKLMKADIICEIKYPEWLANVVMVKKANGKWRMCVDYTDLNAACPKDPYPLPSIDQLIDATSGHLMLSFMDAFSGYNQVKMNPTDIAKTAFITHRAVYAYKLMPFGLRNAGSTYQKAMNEIFKDQLGRNLECYVDDIISKSTSVPGHISDLRECFENMRRTKLKLNPDKCTFGVEAGKFLGFMVSNRGIEANPEKIKAVQEMQPPRTQREVQKLAGSLAALRRFVSKLAERCLPFFELLKGAKNQKLVEWSPDCQKALNEIKAYLSKPPILTKALPGEPLYLYLSAGPLAVGAALIREEAGQQKPVYYVSQNLTIYSDSQIVVRQTNGEYLAKDPILTKYQALVKSYLTLIPGCRILQVNREGNAEADNLSRLVQNSADLDSSVYFEELHKPTIEHEEIFEINNDPTWMTPLINYIEKGELPEDKGKAQRLKAKAAKFFVEEGTLFRRTYSSPILKCIGPEEAEYCLREVHEGICGDHMSAKGLAYKIIRQGYYWPNIHQDAMEFVKKCKNCQLFSNVPRLSPVLPSSVLSPIPFAVWGIDIMGPFPRAKGDLRYLLVSIDYMTKWVEAKAMRTINQQDVIRFMDNILMRFGLPRVLVSDNGPQFIGSDFESYLAERGIKHKKSSVAYPQGNGQVEVTNWILLRGIEKRLEESKSKWPEELPHVLWSYRTSPRTSTGETPFKLAYGTEAMLPIEVGSPSHRVINFDEIANEEGLRVNLDLVDEVRDQAIARMEKYKEKTRGGNAPNRSRVTFPQSDQL
nr:PREDICTED: uncharacterized protein K02A2.6-like [Daucus carota subsp. sativus]